MQPIARNQKRMARNILAVWRGASPEDMATGLQWYEDAHKQAQRIATLYGLSVDTVATVISILSPGNKWERNVREAEALIVAHLWGDPIESVMVSTYGPNKLKAWTYLQGRIPEPFGPRAPKTRAFAALIADPSDDSVCVDGHATNIALGASGPISDVPQVTPKRYKVIAGAYRLAALSLGIEPHKVQAVTWVAWR